jgi:hypothetical protein
MYMGDMPQENVKLRYCVVTSARPCNKVGQMVVNPSFFADTADIFSKVHNTLSSWYITTCIFIDNWTIIVLSLIVCHMNRFFKIWFLFFFNKVGHLFWSTIIAQHETDDVILHIHSIHKHRGNSFKLQNYTMRLKQIRLNWINSMQVKNILFTNVFFSWSLCLLNMFPSNDCVGNYLIDISRNVDP